MVERPSRVAAEPERAVRQVKREAVDGGAFAFRPVATVVREGVRELQRREAGARVHRVHVARAVIGPAPELLRGGVPREGAALNPARLLGQRNRTEGGA